jgi:hypothetical protein
VIKASSSICSPPKERGRLCGQACTCQPPRDAGKESIRCIGPCRGQFHAACAGYPLEKSGGRQPRMWLCRACFEEQTGGVACICQTAYNPARYQQI